MATRDIRPEDELLTPSEAAAMFGVDRKTLTRWAGAGRLESLRTLGGHRRYRRSQLQALQAATRHDRIDEPFRGA